MNKPKIKIGCFGEILWDVFPHQELLGGAPLNVALRLHQLGADVHMISAVGDDPLGANALRIISERGMGTEGIQIHKKLSTGAVHISLKEGNASYTFEDPSAWDGIEMNQSLRNRVSQQEALVFGSLALRHPANRIVLNELLVKSAYPVFDINLRPPYTSKEVILEMLPKVQFLKMNEEELGEVSAWLTLPSTDAEKNILKIANRFEIPSICVTRGDQGAILYHSNRFFYHSGFRVKVADTVGAGDSFLAGLLFQLLTKNTPENALRYASALGALVASKEGANGKVSSEEIMALLKA
ncbi:carbohydrate kinase family protein [Altibacter sp. HG106]|uniref:carbohydrate kinase family protein n=1 Tax=Altibacter sp. HG106 TaxID=3023937 RepID=UPI002350CC20|nr:carbohydrate kinase [Altibacter sp. HG106]MDC7994201.1 carbohydrate kinase [Altibacter sp. HG106]